MWSGAGQAGVVELQLLVVVAHVRHIYNGRLCCLFCLVLVQFLQWLLWLYVLSLFPAPGEVICCTYHVTTAYTVLAPRMSLMNVHAYSGSPYQWSSWCRALTDRPWLVKELLGGKEAWGLRQWEAGALLLSTFAHAALIGKQLPDPQEQEEFKKLAKPLLQGVLPKNKSVQAKDSSAGLGYSDVIFTVGSALQLLEA